MAHIDYQMLPCDHETMASGIGPSLECVTVLYCAIIQILNVPPRCIKDPVSG